MPKKPSGRKRVPLTTTIDPVLIAWLDRMIAEDEFATKSFAINKALKRLKADYDALRNEKKP